MTSEQVAILLKAKTKWRAISNGDHQKADADQDGQADREFQPVNVKRTWKPGNWGLLIFAVPFEGGVAQMPYTPEAKAKRAQAAAIYQWFRQRLVLKSLC